MVADVIGVQLLFAQDDLEHGDNPCEFQVVEALLKWLVLIDDGDVANLVALVETLDPVLDELCKLYRALDRI